MAWKMTVAAACTLSLISASALCDSPGDSRNDIASDQIWRQEVGQLDPSQLDPSQYPLARAPLIRRVPNAHSYLHSGEEILRQGSPRNPLGLSAPFRQLEIAYTRADSPQEKSDLLSDMRSLAQNMREINPREAEAALAFVGMAHYQVAMQATSAGDFRTHINESIDLFDSIARRAIYDTSTMESERMLGQIKHFSLGDSAAAVPHYERMVQILRNSSDEEVRALAPWRLARELKNLADIRISLGDYRGAAEALRAIIDDDSTIMVTRGMYFDALLGLAKAHDSAGMREEAVEAYSLLIESILEFDDVPGDIVTTETARIRAMGFDPHSMESAQEYARIWNNPEYRQFPQILLVGNELAFAHRNGPIPDRNVKAELEFTVLIELEELLQVNWPKLAPSEVDQHFLDTHRLVFANVVSSLGTHYEGRGMFKSAIDLYERFYKFYPDHPIARNVRDRAIGLAKRLEQRSRSD